MRLTQISTRLFSLGSQVSETLQLMEMSGLTPDNCEKFLTVHLRVLHPQHAHMLDVKHSLLHILGHHEVWSLECSRLYTNYKYSPA